MNNEEQKRIRKLEDNNLKMQQKQDDILDKIQELKNCSITADEMDLANEKLIERVFKKVEENFARKERVDRMQKSLNYIFGGISALTITAVGYLIKSLIDLI